MKPKSGAQKLKELFIVFFTSMLVSFAGGQMVLPMIKDRLCKKYGLLSEDKILEDFALGQSLPGIVSLNAGLLIGRRVAGALGAAVVAFAVIFPAFCTMLLIALAYDFINGVSFIEGAINGVRAASVAIIFIIALDIVRRSSGAFKWVIIVFAFAAPFFFNMNIILVIIISGLFSAFMAFRQKRRGLEEPEDDR
ncbi:MAG: chromate transporter [Clostridiales bacterium]|jgi:chromate transporter|nr:chromate transporter [Clostridiales bacterium]